MQYRMVVLPLGTERGLVPLVACVLSLPSLAGLGAVKGRPSCTLAARQSSPSPSGARTLVALAAGAFILECLTKEAL
jgi:hypothetical protein